MGVTQNESILLSIKKLLGVIDIDDSSFDDEIIIHINTVLSNLVQMGVGQQEGFHITGSSETWEDFIGDLSKMYQVKSYVYLKVRLLFDPPSSSVLVDSINKQAAELEWRLYIEKGGY